MQIYNVTGVDDNVAGRQTGTLALRNATKQESRSLEVARRPTPGGAVCPTCLDVVTEPVTAECGHFFRGKQQWQ